MSQSVSENAFQAPPGVVITGIGILSPLGIGIDEFTANLLAGRSGITEITLYKPLGVPGPIGGEIRGFNEKTNKQFIRKQKKAIKTMCREIQLGVASAQLAMDHAGLDEGGVEPERLGVEFGANLMLTAPHVLQDPCLACVDESRQFHHEQWGTTGMRSMEPLWLLQYLPNMPACHITIGHDARGPSNSLTMADASGNMAIGEAMRIIIRGHADVMITGTTGTTLHPMQTLHAVMWDENAEVHGDPASACRPFDLNRTGQVVSEGSCTLMLENERHAEARNARIYGRILGTGSSCVFDRQGRPDPVRAMVLAMRRALRHAGVKPEEIGHINANARGSRQGDREEAAAILEFFGDLGRTIPVTAFKSYWGNPGASSGTLEIAGSLVGLQQGVVLPTRNYTTPDPDCPLNVVRGEPLPVKNKTFLKVNVTRMGQASASVISGA